MNLFNVRIYEMFKKTLAAVAVAAVSVMSSLNSAAAEEEKILNIYNWSDYIDPEIIPMFEKETGIKVVYDVFDSNEVLDAKILSGKTGYDIVAPGLDFMARQQKAGVYLELDKSKLPNLANIDPVQLSFIAKLDPDNAHGIPYFVGTEGIAYNKKMIEERLGKDFDMKTWDVIFKPEILSKLKDCGVAVLNAPTEVIPTALNYLGLNPNSTNLADYKKAEELLIKMRPNVTYFHSSQNINDLANGDICITLGWSGDVLQAADRAVEAQNGVEIEYLVPREGALMFYDMFAIPKDAEHVENAYKFMNFIMRPDIAAKNSSYVSYDNANKAGAPMVIDKVRNNPNIFIPEEQLKKMWVPEVHPRNINKEMTKIWNRVKAS